MATLYAAFADAQLAERAAGALIDHGVHPQDISLVANAASSQTAIMGSPREVGDTAIYADSPGNPLGTRPAPAAVIQAVAAPPPPPPVIPADASDYDPALAAERRAEQVEFDRGLHTTVATPPGSTVTPVVPLTPGQPAPYDREAAAKSGLTFTTPEDAEAGAAKGAGVGLGLGILAGLATLLVPGVGLIVGGGALAAALGLAAATTAAGAIAGGVVGLLVDQGVPREAAQSYSSAVEDGGAILAVQAPSGNVSVTTVTEMINKYGGREVGIY